MDLHEAEKLITTHLEQNLGACAINYLTAQQIAIAIHNSVQDDCEAKYLARICANCKSYSEGYCNEIEDSQDTMDKTFVKVWANDNTDLSAALATEPTFGCNKFN